MLMLKGSIIFLTSFISNQGGGVFTIRICEQRFLINCLVSVIILQTVIFRCMLVVASGYV